MVWYGDAFSFRANASEAERAYCELSEGKDFDTSKIVITRCGERHIDYMTTANGNYVLEVFVPTSANAHFIRNVNVNVTADNNGTVSAEMERARQIVGRNVRSDARTQRSAVRDILVARAVLLGGRR